MVARLAILVLTLWTAGPSLAWAGAGKIDHARAIRTRIGYDFLITLSHAGDGEPFGINRWSVTTDRGERLKVVVPTRPRPTGEAWESWMTGVAVPPDAKSLTLRLHDKVHGFEGVAPLVIDLAKAKGERYEIVDEEKPEKYRRFFGGRIQQQLRRNGGWVPWEW